MSFLLSSVIALLCSVSSCLASWGDKSSFFTMCVKNCWGETCREQETHQVWEEQQSLPEKVVGWKCMDDCRYNCMWETVTEMKIRHGQVPQFHGKWPFIRILGIQEPASTLFSIFNLLSNLYMLNWFVKIVPSTTPMFSVWVLYSVTAVNAWVWSTVFHTRDTEFTEMMDYFCAFSTVLFSLLAFFLRLVGTDNTSTLVVSSLTAAFFSHHIYHMAFIHFDYGYNMRVNVCVGAVNCVCWLGWFSTHSKDGAHVMKGVGAVVVLIASVLLELLDFPPLLRVVDSHALWHLATAPLPLLWYQFAAGDCLKIAREGELAVKKIA